MKTKCLRHCVKRDLLVLKKALKVWIDDGSDIFTVQLKFSILFVACHVKAIFFLKDENPEQDELEDCNQFQCHLYAHMHNANHSQPVGY